MKKSILFMLYAVFPLFVFAQNADTILSSATKNFKKIKCLKSIYNIQLTENNNTSSHNGCIILQGNKYVNYFNGTTIWFNGKTMWTLVKENEEVTITEPDKDDLMNSNPYYFLDNYKKDFNAKLTASNTSSYVIQLTPKQNNSEIKKFLITLSKANYQPLKFQINSKKNNVTITIKSYESIKSYKTSAFTYDKGKCPEAEIVDLR